MRSYASSEQVLKPVQVDFRLVFIIAGAIEARRSDYRRFR
jgi:hypothetical protein